MALPLPSDVVRPRGAFWLPRTDGREAVPRPLALGHEQPPGEFPGGSMRMIELLTTVDSHHPLGAAASLHFWQGGAAPDPIPCSPLLQKKEQKNKEQSE